MDHIKFIGNGDGVIDNGVHFPAANGDDYTLCGITLDHDPFTAGDYVSTSKKVDCEQCIGIVEFGKKIKKSQYVNQTK